MGFTKLDEGILQSSVMAAPPITFKVWIALLAACRSNGVAPVSPTYLASVCRLSPTEVGRALSELSSPDPNSRTTTDDGRRIARVDGGFRLINYLKYRDLGFKEVESAARVERRRKARGGGGVRTGSGLVPDPSASAAASVSASDGERGAGGGGAGDAFYRPARQLPPVTPVERAEHATKAAINHAQLELAALLTKLSEHPKSTRSLPDWCRTVTAYDDRNGDRRNGVADFRTIFNLDRLERSIEDAKWHLGKLDGKDSRYGA